MNTHNFDLSLILRKLLIILLCFIIILNKVRTIYIVILFMITLSCYLLILYKKQLEKYEVEAIHQDELIMKITNLKASYIYKEYEELLAKVNVAYEIYQLDLDAGSLETFNELEDLKNEKLELYNNTVLKDINYEFYWSKTNQICESIFKDFSIVLFITILILFFIN